MFFAFPHTRLDSYSPFLRSLLPWFTPNFRKQLTKSSLWPAMKQRLIVRAAFQGKTWSENDFKLGFKKPQGCECRATLPSPILNPDPPHPPRQTDPPPQGESDIIITTMDNQKPEDLERLCLGAEAHTELHDLLISMIEEESDLPRENQVDFMYEVDFGKDGMTTGLPMMNGHVLGLKGEFDVPSVLVKQTEQTLITGPALLALEKNNVSLSGGTVPTILPIPPFEFMPLSKYRRVLSVGGEQISRKEDVKRVTDSAKRDRVKVMIELGPICDSSFVKERKKVRSDDGGRR